MKIEFYDGDYDYIHSRFAGTFVIDTKKTVFVRVDDVLKNNFMVYCPLTATQYKLPYKDVDIKSPQLGYYDYKGKAYFSFRRGARYWKQGINSHNCSFLSQGDMFSQGCANQILQGRYKLTSDKVESLFCGEILSLALSRNFAINKDSLFYRTVKVGVFMSKSDNFPAILSDEYKFLEQAFEEETHRNVF